MAGGGVDGTDTADQRAQRHVDQEAAAARPTAADSAEEPTEGNKGKGPGSTASRKYHRERRPARLRDGPGTF